MNKRRIGNRHHLPLYQRAIDRLWKYTLPLGILLGVLWYWSYLIPAIQPPSDAVLFIVSAMLLVFSLLVLGVRRIAYVQAYPDHVRVVTPLLRLRISFRRVRSVRPVEIRQIFPPQSLSSSQRNLLEPFFGETAVALELNGFPVKQRTLRFFLPPLMFLPTTTGLVFIVKDWMALSTEIDSFRGTWRDARSQRPKARYGIR